MGMFYRDKMTGKKIDGFQAAHMAMGRAELVDNNKQKCWKCGKSVKRASIAGLCPRCQEMD